jgi:6-phosphogluconolactonase
MLSARFVTQTTDACLLETAFPPLHIGAQPFRTLPSFTPGDSMPRYPAYVLAAILLMLTASTSIAQTSGKQWVYFGTYSRAAGGNKLESKGIYRSEFDLATGKLSKPELAGEATSPSFLAIHPSGKFLYCVNEISNLDGKKVGGITGFTIVAKSGELRKLNQQTSGGAGPCHISVDRTGKVALAANYGGGSVCAHPINDDGTLGEMSAFVQHTGSSADPRRQKEPHAHSINVDPTNQFALAADLGLDKVLIYKLDAKSGKLAPNDPAFGSVAPGSGPRHFAFHPSGKYGYVCNEITSGVTAFTWDAAKGSLTELQTLSTLPHEVQGNSTAEVQAHPNGKFVYVSNRGHNSIAIFTVDPATGKLTASGHQAENIKTPRNFGIDPTGTYLLVCNQDSDSVIVHKIDQSTGKLTPIGEPVPVPTPVCVKFLPQS